MAEEHDSWVHRAFGVHPAAEPGVLATAGGFLKGLGEGVLDGAKGMVVGVYDLGKAAVKEGYALATDEKERARVGDAAVEAGKAVGQFADKAVHDPAAAAADVKNAAKAGVAIAKQVGHMVAADYEKAKKEGHGAEFIGKGVGEAAVTVASFFIPGGGEAKAATLAADAAKAAEAASIAGKAAEAASVAADAAKLAKAAEAAEAAASAAKLAKAAEGAAAVGKAAEAAKATEAAEAALATAKSAEAAQAVEAAKLAEAAKAGKAGEAGAKAATDAAELAAAEAREIEEAAKAIKLAERAGPPHPPADYAALKAANPDDFAKAQTFKPKGMSKEQFLELMKTPEGKAMMKAAVADPAKDVRSVARLQSMLMSGAEAAPKIEQYAQPLVKIVPAGNKVGDFSAFFGTPENLNKAVQSGKNLAEFFGLPASSEAAAYDVYMIVPKGAQAVIINTVAPTVEFGGAVERGGGAIQHLVADRKLWSAPKLIGRIFN